MSLYHHDYRTGGNARADLMALARRQDLRSATQTQAASEGTVTSGPVGSRSWACTRRRGCCGMLAVLSGLWIGRYYGSHDRTHRTDKPVYSFCVRHDSRPR